MKTGAKRALVASAFGFLVLLPPVAGQAMHPGWHDNVKSPVAAQIAQSQELRDSSQIRSDTTEAKSKIPGGLGSARQSAVLGLMRVSIDADQQARLAEALRTDSADVLEKLRGEVGLDARIGFVVDQYWFGVPDQNHVFHQVRSDADAIARLDRGIDDAAAEARAAARGEVSNLLYEESPSFHRLRDQYDVAHQKLTTAEKVEQLAEKAHDQIQTAEHFMCCATPRLSTSTWMTTRMSRRRGATGRRTRSASRADRTRR